jgi:glutathione S-transferase
MYQLFYHPGNANLIPHILLEELGQPYQLILLDLANNEQKGEAYLKLNPAGRVPLLVEGEFALSETAAICLHLADRHAEAQLLPAVGSLERASCYQWLFYLSNTLQPELMLFYYPERWLAETAHEDIRAQLSEHLAGMLALIEAALSDGRAYLAGEAYSVVDPYLFVLCRWTRGLSKSARHYPYLNAYLEKLSARPALQSAFAAEGITAPLY